MMSEYECISFGWAGPDRLPAMWIDYEDNREVFEIGWLDIKRLIDELQRMEDFRTAKPLTDGYRRFVESSPFGPYPGTEVRELEA